MKINQAVCYVTYQDGNTANFRITRRSFDSVKNSLLNTTGFKYAKIFEIVNYKKHTKHQLGNKIGYITLKSDYYNPNGIFESQQSQEFYRKRILNSK